MGGAPDKGRFLGVMVMPSIGTFAAWTLVAALGIPAVWISDEHPARPVAAAAAIIALFGDIREVQSRLYS